MDRVERTDVAERMAASKARLSDRLSELARRVETTRESIRPVNLLGRPWVLFGIAAVVGYAIGGRSRSRALLPERAGEPPPPRESFVAHALKQLALTAAVAVTRSYVSRMSAGEHER